MNSIHKEKPLEKFASISNRIAQNPKLSAEALGLLTYLSSLPEAWEINVKQIEKRFSCGKARRIKMMKELEDQSHMIIVHLKIPGGYGGRQWMFFSNPDHVADFLKDNPDVSISRRTENPTVRKPDGLKTRPSYNKEDLNIKKEYNKEEPIQSHPCQEGQSVSGGDSSAVESEVAEQEHTKPEGRHETKPVRTRKPFIPPTVDEVVEYVRERDMKEIDPYKFHGYYADPEVDWKMNTGKRLKDWKRAVVSWRSRNTRPMWENDPAECLGAAKAPNWPLKNEYERIMRMDDSHMLDWYGVQGMIDDRGIPYSKEEIAPLHRQYWPKTFTK